MIVKTEREILREIVKILLSKRTKDEKMDEIQRILNEQGYLG